MFPEKPENITRLFCSYLVGPSMTRISWVRVFLRLPSCGSNMLLHVVKITLLTFFNCFIWTLSVKPVCTSWTWAVCSTQEVSKPKTALWISKVTSCRKTAFGLVQIGFCLSDALFISKHSPVLTLSDLLRTEQPDSLCVLRASCVCVCVGNVPLKKLQSMVLPPERRGVSGLLLLQLESRTDASLLLFKSCRFLTTALVSSETWSSRARILTVCLILHTWSQLVSFCFYKSRSHRKEKQPLPAYLIILNNVSCLELQFAHSFRFPPVIWKKPGVLHESTTLWVDLRFCGKQRNLLECVYRVCSGLRGADLTSFCGTRQLEKFIPKFRKPISFVCFFLLLFPEVFSVQTEKWKNLFL